MFDPRRTNSLPEESPSNAGIPSETATTVIHQQSQPSFANTECI